MKKTVTMMLATLLVLSMGTALAANTATTTTTTAATTTTLTMEDAKALALEAAGLSEADVFLTKLNLDHDDGRQEYEIEFLANGQEYEYDIDATTGEVRKSSTETADGRMKDLNAGDYITMDAAKDKAIEVANIPADQASIREMEFDFDDGRAEYEVKFDVGTQVYQIKVDAITGDVFSLQSNAKK